MNAPTFGDHSPTCPICRQSKIIQANPLQPANLLVGLLTCPVCRERLVISRSGHYVRDPFTLKHTVIERSLRRNSHPFFRILRDLRPTRSNIWLAIAIGAMLLGLTSVLSNKLAVDSEPKMQPSSPSPIQLAQ